MAWLWNEYGLKRVPARKPRKPGEKPRLAYVERDLSRSEQLIASLTDVLAPPLAVAVGQALGLDALPAPVVEEMAALKDLTRVATRGQWDRAAAVHCLCGVP